MAELGDFVTVTADDVEQGWRRLTSDQKAAIEAILERAEPILVSQSPGLLDRLAADTVPVEAVEQVLIQAARRAALPMFNPEGFKRFSKSIDDYAEAGEWDTDALAAAGLYFTSAELGTLTGPKGRRSRAYTVNTMPPPTYPTY